jgi:HEAT repeat protein
MTESLNTQPNQPKSWRTDPRSNEDLLQVALTEPDDDRAWDAIMVLHLRGSPEIFEAARTLSTSAMPHERQVAVHILGQVGLTEQRFQEEAVLVLLELLHQEQNPEVLSALGVALGHRHDPRAMAPLASLKTHPDERVRFGVVLGLSGYEEEMAVQTLIDLSADPDAEGRDWATFELGDILDLDTPAIRQALLARLEDEDEATWGEAMLGLARRHDQRVVEPLLAALEGATFRSLQEARTKGRLLEAAAEIGDVRLYPAHAMRNEMVRRISGRKECIKRYQDCWNILCTPD